MNKLRSPTIKTKRKSLLLRRRELLKSLMTNALSIKRLNTQPRIIKIGFNKGTLKREGLLNPISPRSMTS